MQTYVGTAKDSQGVSCRRPIPASGKVMKMTIEEKLCSIHSAAP